MKKLDQKRLGAALDKALAPPKKDRKALDSLLDDYDDSPRTQHISAPVLIHTPPTPPTLPTSPTPVSPQRDFTKVANSIVRDLVASGSFVGKSKQLYDYLYLRTRGAINPKRTFAIPKPELMKGAGIGSERTLLKNLRHLTELGIVQIKYTDGKHSGNEYTVLLPEEAPTPPTSRTPPTDATPPHAGAELPSVPPAESGVRDVGKTSDNSTAYALSNTSFKTTTNIDDEPFGILNEKFRKLSEEVTGKRSSQTERERWGELADTLIEEFHQAATHTKAVSSVPAFLTAHLQRRFVHAAKAKPSSLVKKDSVGKAVPSPEPQPITEVEREELRRIIIEMVTSGGYTLEQAETQFGTGLTQKEWDSIRDTMSEQGSDKSTMA